ncbi:hypothetical protein [Microvirga thermotolerans]|uniref:Secreted protein n=1 Tax=Microvirga thermotolerans TaxID=2651334 RepID=A0A5P9JVN3_9HYPH|nr:hypothetical protein [Microvirga thermotolerans]QFU16259.1 hypothetical protein GDR74_08495 [Microvirga thermotolerans]
MRAVLRPVLAAIAIAASTHAALAAASNMPTQYQPDPALKTASMGELQSRVRQACAVTQARMQNVSELSMSRKCDCYAGRTMRALSADEVQAYRDTGVFNETARAKALGALDACKLPRPQM